MSISLQNKGLMKTVVAMSVALMASQFAQAEGISFTTKNGAEAKLYGGVRVDAAYSIRGTDAVFHDVSTNNGEKVGKLVTTAKLTRLGFDFKAPVEGQEVGGKIEGDFAGNGEGSKAFRLRHAYMTTGNWLIGQTDSLYGSDNEPSIIDNSDPVGGDNSDRNVQVRYTMQTTPSTTVAAALESQHAAGNDGATYRIPALSANLSQDLAGKGAVSVRGLVVPHHVVALDKTKTGFAVAAGFNYQVAEPAKVMLDVAYGRGLESNVGSSGTFAIVDGKYRQNQYTSVLAGAEFQVAPQLVANVGYGVLRNDTKSEFAKAQGDKFNKTVYHGFVNAVYSPVKAIDLGVEYGFGQRKDVAGKAYKEQAVNVMAKYKF
ncbi:MULTISPECIES: DcaP family trimeric outer membrane transporter [unclassified Acinetobacter]|uniref:DcaP family trimeric outer membrane transporter n=1 Tax=unclassified Acinetobacter TaxID=196816 RepID=UPI0035B8E955